MNCFIRFGALLLTLIIIACGPFERTELSSTPEALQASSVTIMTLNVQNLFDNLDDPGKDDKAYLPLKAKQNQAHKDACSQIKVANWRRECLELDWSDAALAHKMSVLAKVIRQVADGQGADVIALQEVENEYVLEQLRTGYLAELGYHKSVLIEGTDKRGIDVAFLSKLPLVGTPTLHPLVISTHSERAKDTRGILEAQFRMPDGTTLTGFAVHFPAPYHPTAMRVAAYRHLQSLRQALSVDDLVFAAGDFNTTSTEDEREGLLDKMVRPYWEVAHDDCADCRGTYYYAPDDNWSFLDMILVSRVQADSAGWRIRSGSVQIANSLPEQSTQGRPARYRASARSGASDHWPLILTLQKQ